MRKDGFLVPGLWFLVRSLRFKTFSLAETTNHKPQTTNQKSQTKNQKPETRNLFISKCHHRIYLSRAAGRNVTSQQRDSGKQQRHSAEGPRVPSADTEQKVRHQVRQP